MKNKKPVGRPKIKFNIKTILAIIDDDKNNPSIYFIAKKLGCSTNPLRRYIHKHPEIQDAINLRWDKLQDKSYEVWDDVLSSDDIRAKMELSKWIMAHRNPLYKDNVDINVNGQIDHTIKINITKDSEDDLKQLLND